MKALIIQNDPVEGLGLYETLLRDEGEVDVVHAYLQGASVPPASGYDLIVVGPTPIPANEAEAYPFLARELHNLSAAISSGMPVLGVCCGGQLLSRLLGGQVVRCPKMEVGGYQLELTDAGKRDPIFVGFPNRFPVFHWHRDMFTVPPDGEELATGNPCPVQAFAKGQVRGVVFHLEIDHLDAARWADAYPGELTLVGKTKAQVVEECRSSESEMGRLAERLVRNLVDLAT